MPVEKCSTLLDVEYVSGFPGVVALGTSGDVAPRVPNVVALVVHGKVALWNPSDVSLGIHGVFYLVFPGVVSIGSEISVPSNFCFEVVVDPCSL